MQYGDFAHWQRQWLTGEVLDAQIGYWKQHLAHLPLLRLPTDRPRPKLPTFHGGVHELALGVESSAALRDLSRRSGATLFMTLFSAFASLLGRYSGQQDLAVGSPIANRNRREVEPLIGFFVNTLVLRCDLAADPTWQELIGRVRSVTLEAYANQDLPFEQLVEELQPERDTSRNPLVQVSFVLQNAPRAVLELPELTLSALDFGVTTVRFDLEFHLWEEDAGLRGALLYSTDLFDPTTIARLTRHFQQVLDTMVAQPEQRTAVGSLLTAAERHHVRVESEGPRQDLPEEHTVVDLFEAQVDRAPDAVAMVYDTALSTVGAPRQLSFSELDARADQLAQELRVGLRGEDAGAPAGLCLRRSPEMVCAVVAVLKSDGAFVPLDPTHPTQRLAFLLRDARVRVLLTERDLAERLPHTGERRIYLEDARRLPVATGRHRPARRAQGDDLAYLIYTSGSTGRPKGTMIPHRGLLHYLSWCMPVYTDPGSGGSPLHSSIGFDATLTSLFVPLLSGRSIHLVPEKREAEELCAALEHGRFSFVKLTPAHLVMLGQLLADREHGLPPTTMVLGGEALPASAIAAWRALAPGARFVNEYGPTETVVGCCVYEVPARRSPAPTVPIGRPIARTRILVLDRHLESVPLGLSGELCIGGAGLARGYLGRPARTSRSFVPCPAADQPGARLYRTGDRARFSSSGDLVFLGRLDHQVKLRGHRVELGEIETVLGRNPAVRETVVTVLSNPEEAPGGERLVAFLRLDPDGTADRADEAEEKQVSQWQALYEETYGGAEAPPDPTFDVVGWNSSYTGEPLPDEEMSEWVERTVERILALGPDRVLEIGCGTGLLLTRIAPRCSRYCATDFSSAVLEKLERRRKTLSPWGEQGGTTLPGLEHVELLHRAAHDLDGIGEAAFDTVVINSVVQYFPSVRYLLEVLEGALRVVRPGGRVFLGDVRDLRLLEHYHASVELHRASASLRRDELDRRLERRMAEEEELAIDPDLFHAVRRRWPRIATTRVLVKRGRHHNELTRFRYDVVLEMEGGGSAESRLSRAEQAGTSRCQEGLDLADVRQRLEEERPPILALSGVPNRRLAAETKILEWLRHAAPEQAVGQLLNELTSADAGTADPEDLWELCNGLPYRVEVGVSANGFPDHGSRVPMEACFDAVFLRSDTTSNGDARPAPEARPWRDYANDPVRAMVARALLPRLRRTLEQSLPGHMVPAVLVPVDAWPLNANGKVDRAALARRPLPESSRDRSGDFIAPRNHGEQTLADLWSEVLGLDRVGVHDNFFDLGGHSLLATQLISRIRRTFEVELPLHQLFENPTVAQLNGHVEKVLRITAELRTAPEETLEEREEFEL